MNNNSIAFRIAVSPSQTASVLGLVTEFEGRASEPLPASSTANPLNAPVSGGDIQAFAEVVTAVFGAGTAGASFVRALIKLAREKKTRIEITNVKTNKTTQIDDTTDPDDVMK